MERIIKDKDIRLKRLPSYLKFVREQGVETNILRPGYFYTYNYRFDLNPHFPKLSYDEVRFYDWYPLVFIYDVYREKKTNNLVYRGLNFHHLPVRSRRLWLTRLKKYIDHDEIEEDTKIKPLVDYSNLRSLFIKATFGIRNYRRDRMFNIQRVPNYKLDSYLGFAAKTYFASTLAEVGLNYKSFDPRRRPNR